MLRNSLLISHRSSYLKKGVETVNLYVFGSGLTLLVLIGFLVGCGQGPDSSVRESQTDHAADKTIIARPVATPVLDSIVNSGELSYYVPSSALEKSRLDIALFFDPQGDGTLPLTKYRNIADRFGMAIIGSNVSKNGMTMGPISSHYAQLKSKINVMFPDRDGSTVLAGFSGGAKVAMELGLNDPSVDGVVASGAMLDPGLQRPGLPISVIAGKGDFNGTSMLISALQLDQRRGNVLFQSFNGGHSWPSETEMSRSLLWILQKRSSVASSVVQNEFLRLADTLSHPEISGLKEFLVLNSLIKMFPAEKATARYRTRLEQVVKSQLFNNDLTSIKQSLRSEGEMRQQYIGQVSTKDLEWWKKESDRLKDLSHVKGEKGFAAQRTLGFLGLYCYMAGQKALNVNAPNARSIIDVYVILEPDNPEAQRMKSELR